jgi:hypothetical protein
MQFERQSYDTDNDDDGNRRFACRHASFSEATLAKFTADF